MSKHLRILAGDNLASLRRLAADGVLVDSVVTDPPYGLSFMGKKWDYQVPSVEFWQLVYAVLKPGGHVLSFGGTRTYHRMACALEDAGFEIRDQLAWIYGSGFPKSKNVGGGYGTALKPACEPIALARKPLGGKTVASNVLAFRTGALNIDGCRIGTDEKLSGSGKPSGNVRLLYRKADGHEFETHAAGRWPANVIFDADAAAVLDAQSGKRTGSRPHATKRTSVKEIAGAQYDGGFKGQADVFFGYDDAGGASRFFYCAKASAKERAGSTHPTVKPVELMRYLCRLVTPRGGTILDPFAGSGTTGEAALREGFSVVLMEREAAYIADIRRRLGAGEAAA